MGYQKAIGKFKEIYRQISLEEVLSLWDKNDRNLNVYIHSPFCATICKFCYYKGVKFDLDDDAELYDKFYNDYLPRAIKPFLPIIANKKIGNYFFGGGTPSLMKPETMVSIFNLFPGFKKVKSKTFEIHPAIYTDEQLDVLAEHGFNCCIIGIQSFNKDVLDRQNRLYASPDEIFSLAQKIKSRGMHVAGDIIYKMDNIDVDEIFKQDLIYLEQIDLSVISLQNNYDLNSNDETISKFLRLIENSNLSGDYYWESQNKKGDMPIVEKKIKLKCFRYVKKNISKYKYMNEIFAFVGSIDEISKWNAYRLSLDLNSTIGFGSYDNSRKNTFSNIADKFNPIEYIEINNNWNPKYYVTYEEDRVNDFQDLAKNYKKIKNLGKPPEGVLLRTRRELIKNDDKIYRNRKNKNICHMIVWKKRNKEIDNYLSLLKNAFPEVNIDLSKTSFFVEI